jgi:hypothetical protein
VFIVAPVLGVGLLAALCVFQHEVAQCFSDALWLACAHPSEAFFVACAVPLLIRACVRIAARAVPACCVCVGRAIMCRQLSAVLRTFYAVIRVRLQLYC